MYGVATQNGVGLGVGNIPTLTSLAYPQMLNAIVLGAFSGGAPGWLYDDSNMSTLFQDAAGTTPVTALEQPVGLQLDLSQGLVLGAELITVAADRNFTSDTGFWTKDAGVTIGSGAATWAAPVAGSGFYRLALGAAGSYYEITYTIGSISAGGLKSLAYSGSGSGPTRTTPGTYTDRLFCTTSAYIGVVSTANGTVATVTGISIKKLAGNHRYQPTSANRPTWSARYNLLLATASLSTQSVTTVATNYVLYFTGAGTVTLSGTSTGTLSAGSNTITCTAGTLTLTVTGSVLTADLRPADQAVGLLPQYQAVVTASNYDSVGFPAGLQWNGSNSWMQNASVDFSGTNKVSVFVGARETSAATTQMIFELSPSSDSASYPGSFAFAPTTSNKFYFQVRGSSNELAYSPALSSVPSTYVADASFDLSANTNATAIVPRINTVVSQTSGVGTAPGGGNFGNYPAYFGARAGTSLFFNGLTFSNVCIGGALSASQIAAFEAWTNSRTKAYA